MTTVKTVGKLRAEVDGRPLGTVEYLTRDGWVGIRDADGATVHEWPEARVTIRGRPVQAAKYRAAVARDHARIDHHRIFVFGESSSQRERYLIRSAVERAERNYDVLHRARKVGV